MKFLQQNLKELKDTLKEENLNGIRQKLIISAKKEKDKTDDLWNIISKLISEKIINPFKYLYEDTSLRYGHDSSAAILIDGEMNSVAEETFSRIKRHFLSNQIY